MFAVSLQKNSKKNSREVSSQNLANNQKNDKMVIPNFSLTLNFQVGKKGLCNLVSACLLFVGCLLLSWLEYRYEVIRNSVIGDHLIFRYNY
jgi:hypothetical protein